MTEKETFLGIHQRECQTTHRLLSAYPADKAEFRPHERSRSARELAFTLANHELLFKQAAEGNIDTRIFGSTVPAAMSEIIGALEKNHQAVDGAVGKAGEAELNQTINFMGHDMRRMDVIWANLFDLIHHRGQFSVYVRLAGGQVPSIYGPSADDPGAAAGAAKTV
jgi:uncharacterized damage-inducible protein DinB